MASSDSKKRAQQLLKLADIKINGTKDTDIQVLDERLYDRVFSEGSMGAGESYMDGWWNVRKLDKFFTQVFTARVDQQLSSSIKLKLAMHYAAGQVRNRQSGKRAYKNAQSHYDIGNDLYEPMLGKSMAYTCAYWERGAKTLDQAQEDKYDLVCEKLQLKRGMKVLDVGCGWGGLAMHMARKYGCEVTCFTPAHEQIEYIRQHAKGLKVKPVLMTWQDYRDKTKYDRIAAIGVLEHVGPKNYSKFLAKMRSLLKDDGLFIMHTIGSNKSVMAVDPWIDKYIFPGGVLPSVKQIATAAEGKFVMEDWHNMGANYDPTLMAWNKNFQSAYSKLDHKKYDERFKRMWEFYLLACAGRFRARNIQLWQVMYSPYGVPGGYKSVR